MPFYSKDPSIPKVWSLKEFIQDRVSLFGSPITSETINSARPYNGDKIRSNFEWIELQFSDDREWFLDTQTPGIADIHVAMNIWFLKRLREVTNPELYPKTYSWLKRFIKYIKSIEIKPKKISGEEALEIAKKFKPFNGCKMNIEQDLKDTQKKLGDSISIEPDDYGKIPVKGKIVSLGDRMIGIRPHDVDKTGIEVVVWFPRAGYRIKPDNGKL